MNERIRQLAEQVGAVQNVLAMGRHDGVLFTVLELEKFAELILEEVMQELFINGYEDAFDFLNEHFGVEE